MKSSPDQARKILCSVQKGKYLEDALDIADSLFHDDEDLFRKGYWPDAKGS